MWKRGEEESVGRVEWMEKSVQSDLRRKGTSKSEKEGLQAILYGLEAVEERRKRDAGYIGRRMLKMELPGKRKKRKAKEEVYGYDEGRHAGGWPHRGRCRGQEEMESDDPLW